MATFVELLGKRRAGLELKLRERDDPESVSRLIADTLDQLVTEYLGARDTSLPARRTLRLVADSLRSSVQLLASAGETEVLYRSDPAIARTHVVAVNRVRMIQGALAATALLSLHLLGNEVAAIRPNALSPLWPRATLVCFTAVVLIELYIVFPRFFAGLLSVLGRFFRRGEQAYAINSIFNNNVIARVCVKPAAALQRLEEVAGALDRVADDICAQPEPRSKSFDLADEKPILDFLHDLSEACESKDAEFALAKARAVPSLLAVHNIEVARDVNGNDRMRFFSESPSPSGSDAEERLLRPAFTRERRCLRRGVILVPDRRE